MSGGSTSIRTRTAACISSAGSVDPMGTACTKPAPDTLQQCTQLPTCVTYSYQLGQWGACSLTCAVSGGSTSIRTRTATCISSAGSVDPMGTACPKPAPDTLQQCTQLPTCVTYSYQLGQWGACSLTCSLYAQQLGSMARAVSCMASSSLAPVASSFCSADPPPSTQPCALQPCVSYACKVSPVRRTRRMPSVYQCQQPLGDVCSNYNRLAVRRVGWGPQHQPQPARWSRTASNRL